VTHALVSAAPAARGLFAAPVVRERILRRISKGRNGHSSHWCVVTVLSLPASVLIKLTRWAYLPVTEPPDAKSFVRNILPISSLKPKILARSRV